MNQFKVEARGGELLPVTQQEGTDTVVFHLISYGEPDEQGEKPVLDIKEQRVTVPKVPWTLLSAWRWTVEEVLDGALVHTLWPNDLIGPLKSAAALKRASSITDYYAAMSVFTRLGRWGAGGRAEEIRQVYSGIPII